METNPEGEIDLTPSGKKKPRLTAAGQERVERTACEALGGLASGTCSFVDWKPDPCAPTGTIKCTFESPDGTFDVSLSSGMYSFANLHHV